MNAHRSQRFALFFLVLLLAGLVPTPSPLDAEEAITTEAQLQALGARRLTAAEIERNFSGRIAYTRIISGDHVGALRTHTFNRDGTFRSRNLWDSKEDGDKWYIADDQRLCRRYRGWFRGHLICRTVYVYDGAYYWVGKDGSIECMVFQVE